MNTFNEILEASSSLTIDEQESFIQILKKRIDEEKRKQIIHEAKESYREYREGSKKTSSIEDIMNEILV